MARCVLVIDGAFFVDRSGETFKYVLDYLRNLDQWEAPKNPDLLLSLLGEALDSLVLMGW